ncbi:beta-lactamase [Sulfuricella sp. T08]|uniref:MBL fold metallo-hydrolase n=1 Tax=Sulfuricella sp. T08 TaxID=1632857 RepID=UPI0006179620|nr:MBL fold metallo-hydrolase [Sulfuricella sp. T08]GAO37462.1 beta-lactamase [Sulfuricella sp. T08]
MSRVCWTLLILIFSNAAYAQTQIPEPKVVKINERVYALLGPMGLPSQHNQGYMVNSTVIVGDQGVILVDSGGTDEVGQHLAKAIAKITPKPVTHIINTHHHGDHVLGNIAFKGAEILSSEQCRALVSKTGEEWVQIMESLVGRKFPGTRPVPAMVTFQEDSTSDRNLQGVKMRLWVPRGSHTPGDMMVYLPDDKVLIGGDILVNTTTPVMRDGHIRNWIAALAKAQDFKAATIVPGHGPLMTMADVVKLHKLLAGFYAGVEAGYKKGLSDSEIRNTLDLSEWKKLKEYEVNMGANISRAYLEVEVANF